MLFVGENLSAKGAHKLFGQVWGNSGKNLSHPQKFACSSIHPGFGMPAYIHSGRGSAFLLQGLITFLLERGVACSRTSAYSAPGNDQCERYNVALFGLL